LVGSVEAVVVIFLLDSDEAVCCMVVTISMGQGVVGASISGLCESITNYLPLT
jgi:hypothetical protein